jgi:hypothetical protein
MPRMTDPAPRCFCEVPATCEVRTWVTSTLGADGTPILKDDGPRTVESMCDLHAARQQSYAGRSTPGHGVLIDRVEVVR